MMCLLLGSTNDIFVYISHQVASVAFNTSWIPAKVLNTVLSATPYSENLINSYPSFIIYCD